MQEIDRIGHLVVPFGGTVDRETTSGVPVRHQPVERDPEKRTGQDTEHTRLVHRILEAAEEQQEGGEFILEAHPRTRHLDGQVAVLEGVRVDREILAGARQDHEIAGLALPGLHAAGDLSRDARGLVLRHIVLPSALDRVDG